MSEIEVRAARAEDVTALVELWASAFSPPLLPDQWLVDDQRLAHTLVAVDRGVVCGSIYGLPKRLRETDGTALVHCIGSVAVADQARGRGIARRLVQATLDSAGDAEWALLFTGTPEVYRSSGFDSFTMNRSLTGPWVPSVLGDASDVFRATVRLGTLADVRDLYERSREGTVLAPVRDARDWAMVETRLAGHTLYTYRVDGTLRGYAITHLHTETGVIEEIAGIDASAWQPLFSAISADWRDAGVTRCDIAV